MLAVGQNYFYPDPLTSPFKRLPVGLKEEINLVPPDRPNTIFHGSPTVTGNFHSCAKRENGGISSENVDSRTARDCRRSRHHSTLSPSDICSGAASLYSIPMIAVWEKTSSNDPSPVQIRALWR